VIPENISREAVMKALAAIDERGVPPRRYSTRYLLKHHDKLYAPKYVLSIANIYANGYELRPEQFAGGRETNLFLQARGFEIVRLQKGLQITYDGLFCHLIAAAILVPTAALW